MGRVATSRRVLVVGDTRGTGLLLAHLLAGRGYGVRVLARDPAAAARRLGSAIEIVPGDVTKDDTLVQATQDVDDIVYTAGVRSGRLAGERRIKETDYDGGDADHAGDLPLRFRYRISRADVAEVCAAALRHPRASRAAFEVVWGRGPRREAIDDLLTALKPD